MPLVSIVGDLTDLIGTYVAQPHRVNMIAAPMVATLEIFEKSFIENSHLVFS